MTTAYAADELLLPEPIGKQPEWLDSPASRKVLRVGRRGTKSRFAMIAAVAGHGEGKDGARQFPGIMEGGDVVWIAQDYPNLTTVMWKEEFEPRFKHLPWAKLRAHPDYSITIDGGGTLFLRSAEAISGIRGIGKNLRGVVIDEAAHLDLERSLKDVILPALLDNGGWLILMSTTNAGLDGNTEKRVPSYFNLICEEIRAGERSDEWQEFTGTAYDNPSLNQAGINELVSEYADGSASLRQEVFAELLTGGVGQALPQIDREHHLIPAQRVPAHWTRFGAFDWGFNHPYVFGDFRCDDDGNIVLVDSLFGRGELPDAIAEKIVKVFGERSFAYIVAGHDCWNEVKARGERTPTIREQMAAKGVVMRKANISRVTGLTNLRLYTQWQASETMPERTPRFRIMDTTNNRLVLANLQAMQLDPKSLEDALKVDADHNGKGGDDAFDMVRYGLASRPFVPKVTLQVPVKDDDRAPSFNYDTQRFDRTTPRQAVDKELARGQMKRWSHRVPRWKSP